MKKEAIEELKRICPFIRIVETTTGTELTIDDCHVHVDEKTFDCMDAQILATQIWKSLCQLKEEQHG